jgi:hypothetical protein
MGAPEKRQLIDEVGETSVSAASVALTPSRPPLKKRFTSCLNIQQQVLPVPVIIAEPEPIASSPVAATKPVKIEFSVSKIN